MCKCFCVYRYIIVAKDKWNCTPLLLAVEENDYEMVHALLRAAARTVSKMFLLLYNGLEWLVELLHNTWLVNFNFTCI